MKKMALTMGDFMQGGDTELASVDQTEASEREQ
jgi:hypothetical protein